MTNFEKITASPEALGEFLAALPIATGPWDECFHRTFCDSCKEENCEAKNCPHQDVQNNPLWWLTRADQQKTQEEALPTGKPLHFRNGRLQQ